MLLIDELFGEKEEKELIELTQKLISIPSYHGLETVEREVGEYIFHLLESEGLEPELIKVLGERANVICGYGSGIDQEKSLMLNGHLDTVAVDNMTIDPFEAFVEGENIYGRGAVDMKGAVAAMIMALLIVKRAGINLEGKIYFAGVIDEERGAEGTRKIVKDGPVTKYAIVGEASNLEIQNGHRGLEWIRIVTEGKFAHGGTPWKGINAIEKMNDVINVIQKTLLPEIMKREHPISGPAYFNLGTIKAGTQPSTVPGQCILEIDRRYIPGETRESVVGELNNILETLALKDKSFKAHAEIMSTKDSMGIGYPPLACDPKSPLVEALKNGLTEMKLPITTSYFPGWTDASLLSLAGVEAVVFGPGFLASAHSDKEFCPVEDLIKVCKIYLHTILELCN